VQGTGDTDPDSLIDTSMEGEHMSKHVVRRLVAGALMGVLALSIAVPAVAASGDGKVRVFHDSPDTPAVDIYANGALVPGLTGVTFGTVSPYLTLPQGSYTFQVKVSPSTPADPAALTATVTLGSRPLTVAAIGSLAGNGAPLQAKVYQDRSGTGGNISLLRVAHTSPNAPAVDVQLRLGKYWVPVIRNLAFGETAGYLPLPANIPFTSNPIKYDFRVVAAGTNTVVLSLPGTTLPRGGAVTVWAVGFLGSSFGPQVTIDGQ
jgi:hypothetical protein